ncbi:tyrosine-protein phosphatase [Thiocapsa marina]|uniref:protein-tyrosine-phosphatase n=1 Tax=Thiocapsa marina 5811 TaxID=768671 RepID=F9UEP9_9GAMM|nr:CpsB/CapC family capsule biosynthesis tyrosine phosphatase [Thiocapsa marina]EGV17370.1 Protein-tyrosine-phosphatase [Thiocapsa marina 5811]
MRQGPAVIDVHCHILPGLDDGAHTFETAIDMARVAVAAGILGIVCTPHHLNGVYRNPAVLVRHALADLRQRLLDAEIPLDLFAGAEIHLVPEVPSRVLDGSALTYNDRGKAVLVELPKKTVPRGTDVILGQLLRHGITPVIAHPERNLALARRPQRLAEWVDWGCKVQLTAQSCSGDFGERLQRLSRRWLESGWVHLIASDAHRPTRRSPDTLSVARACVAAWLGEDAATLLTLDNPRRLLDGEDLIALASGMRPETPPAESDWLRFVPWRRRTP